MPWGVTTSNQSLLLWKFPCVPVASLSSVCLCCFAGLHTPSFLLWCHPPGWKWGFLCHNYFSPDCELSPSSGSRIGSTHLALRCKTPVQISAELSADIRFISTFGYSARWKLTTTEDNKLATEHRPKLSSSLLWSTFLHKGKLKGIWKRIQFYFILFFGP